MAKKINWAITDKNVTVNWEGKSYIVSKEEPLAGALIKALKENKLDEIPNLISSSLRISNFSKGKFEVKDGNIYINGSQVPGALGKKILKFSNEGLPYQPLVKFAEKLQMNPSFRAVNELFLFLDKNDHPITEDGNFIAYKKVRPDFTDIHTGKFDNSPGVTVEMPRNQVDEDATRTCSNGLHVANWNYAYNLFGSPSDTMLEVEVNPADVVSVPVDYDNAKMRVCKYKVLGAVDKANSEDMSLRIVNKLEDSSEEDKEDVRFCIHCDNLLTSYEVSCGGGVCDSCNETDEYPWNDEV